MRMIVNEPLSFFGLESGRARKVRRPNRVKSPTTGNQKCFFCRSEMNNSCKKKFDGDIQKIRAFRGYCYWFFAHDMIDINISMQNICKQGV